MTILTDAEREQGLAEIPSGVVLCDADVQYFRNKLINMLERNAPASAMEKTFKQLALMEDAIVIYHEHRPPESK